MTFLGELFLGMRFRFWSKSVTHFARTFSTVDEACLQSSSRFEFHHPNYSPYAIASGHFDVLRGFSVCVMCWWAAGINACGGPSRCLFGLGSKVMRHLFTDL